MYNKRAKKEGMIHMERRVDCNKCQYYYVTWDPKFPRGCKAFGFKTRELPSLSVFRSSGQPCLRFTPKK